MTQLQILSELNLVPCDLTKKYAAKLINLFKLINELEKMDGFKVELNGSKGNYELVAAMPTINPLDFKNKSAYNSAYNEKVRQQNNCKELYGEFTLWQSICIRHKQGEYNFNFPMNNNLYNKFLSLAGCEIEIQAIQEIKPLNTIVFNSSILKDFTKAIRFISKDDLRPAMQHICVSIHKFKMEIVATDAHQLYQSKPVECSQKESLQLLISESDAKVIAKIKAKDEILEMHILPDNKIMIDDKIFNSFDARYPDYKRVIPNYKKYMKFNKERFVSNVKKVLPSANKCTSQVSFHLNGSISLLACDVDYSFECTGDMPYITKKFPDTDIAFNGNFLLNAMSIFKDENVKMFSDGNATKSAVFTNGNDSVLLMPLMLNN
ncbi:MAG: DNA polymerase III subunit beta [Bacteroidia bacterium]